jgi:hypothetical protein
LRKRAGCARKLGSHGRQFTEVVAGGAKAPRSTCQHVRKAWSFSRLTSGCARPAKATPGAASFGFAVFKGAVRDDEGAFDHDP